LVEDNKSKLAVPKKLNSCKANPNRHRKRPQLELVVGTLTENSNNEPVVCKRQLVKGRYNPSAYKPILMSDSGTKEITVDNSKLPQPITKPVGTHQPNNVIDNPTTTSPTINTP